MVPISQLTTMPEIKDKVYDYLVQHLESCDEEIAAALQLDVITVMSALVELEKEGKARAKDDSVAA